MVQPLPLLTLCLTLLDVVAVVVLVCPCSYQSLSISLSSSVLGDSSRSFSLLLCLGRIGLRSPSSFSGWFDIPVCFSRFLCFWSVPVARSASLASRSKCTRLALIRDAPASLLHFSPTWHPWYASCLSLPDLHAVLSSDRCIWSYIDGRGLIKKIHSRHMVSRNSCSTASS